MEFIKKCILMSLVVVSLGDVYGARTERREGVSPRNEISFARLQNKAVRHKKFHRQLSRGSVGVMTNATRALDFQLVAAMGALHLQSSDQQSSSEASKRCSQLQKNNSSHQLQRSMQRLGDRREFSQCHENGHDNKNLKSKDDYQKVMDQSAEEIIDGQIAKLLAAYDDTNLPGKALFIKNLKNFKNWLLHIYSNAQEKGFCISFKEFQRNVKSFMSHKVISDKKENIDKCLLSCGNDPVSMIIDILVSLIKEDVCRQKKEKNQRKSRRVTLNHGKQDRWIQDEAWENDEELDAEVAYKAYSKAQKRFNRTIRECGQILEESLQRLQISEGKREREAATEQELFFASL